jgi:hypothetical protein
MHFQVTWSNVPFKLAALQIQIRLRNRCCFTSPATNAARTGYAVWSHLSSYDYCVMYKKSIDGTRIGIADNLLDAIKLVEHQSQLRECILRVEGDRACGDILIRDHKRIVDANIHGRDMEASDALKLLLSNATGQFEILKPANAISLPADRNLLSITLELITQGADQLISREGLPQQPERDDRNLIDQSGPYRPKRPRGASGAFRTNAAFMVPSRSDSTDTPQWLWFAAAGTGVLFFILLIGSQLLGPHPVPQAEKPAPSESLPGPPGSYSTHNQTPVSATAPVSSTPVDTRQRKRDWTELVWQAPANPLAAPSAGDVAQASAVIETGKKLQTEGHLKQAAFLYQESLAKYPGVFALRLAAIQAWVRAGDFINAEQLCLRSLNHIGSENEYYILVKYLKKIDAGKQIPAP